MYATLAIKVDFPEPTLQLNFHKFVKSILGGYLLTSY